MQEYDYLICGETRLQVDFEQGKTAVELLQYQRPDLHGYSPFHKEIEGFMRD